VPVLPLEGGAGFRVVKQYRRLGVTVHGGSSMGPEIVSRCSLANVTASAMTRPCLARQSIPQPARVMAAAASCQSRGLYLVGVWPDLSLEQYKQVEAAHCKWLRVIDGAHMPPASPELRVPKSQVLQKLGVVHPLVVLLAARLRSAAKVVRTAPPYPFALFRGPGGTQWRAGVADACSFMWLLLPSKVAALGAPADGLQLWEQLWLSCAVGWDAMVAKLLEVAAADCSRTVSALRCTPACMKFLLPASG
jgi:hypothetical protein